MSLHGRETEIEIEMEIEMAEVEVERQVEIERAGALLSPLCIRALILSEGPHPHEFIET